MRSGEVTALLRLLAPVMENVPEHHEIMGTFCE